LIYLSPSPPLPFGHSIRLNSICALPPRCPSSHPTGLDPRSLSRSAHCKAPLLLPHLVVDMGNPLPFHHRAPFSVGPVRYLFSHLDRPTEGHLYSQLQHWYVAISAHVLPSYCTRIVLPVTRLYRSYLSRLVSNPSLFHSCACSYPCFTNISFEKSLFHSYVALLSLLLLLYTYWKFR